MATYFGSRKRGTALIESAIQQFENIQKDLEQGAADVAQEVQTTQQARQAEIQRHIDTLAGFDTRIVALNNTLERAKRVRARVLEIVS